MHASHDDVKLRDHGDEARARAAGLRIAELCAFTASERVRLYSELNSEWSDVLPRAHAHRSVSPRGGESESCRLS